MGGSFADGARAGAIGAGVGFLAGKALGALQNKLEKAQQRQQDQQALKKQEALKTSIVKSAPSRAGAIDNTSDVLYRHDSRTPGEIDLAGGMWARGDNMDLGNHLADGPLASGYVATTKSLSHAIERGTEGNTVYFIKNHGKGIDISSTFDESYTMHYEQEVAIPRGVPRGDILGSAQIRMSSDGTKHLGPITLQRGSARGDF
jgi:hypothetical protein